MQTSVVFPLASSGLLTQLDAVSQRWMMIERAAAREFPKVEVVLHGVPMRRPLHLTVHGAGGALELALDAAQWPELVALQEIADEVRRDATLNLILARVLSGLRAAGCPFDRFNFGNSEARQSGFGASTLRLDGYDLALLPGANAEPLAGALEDALARLPMNRTPRLLHWPLRTCVALGVRHIARTRLLALRPGDAVFGGLGGSCIVRISATTRFGVQAAAALPYPQKSITMTESFQTAPDPVEAPQPILDDITIDLEPLHAIARLPMEIRYEIDGPHLTVAQAAALSPGDVLTLPVPASQAVVSMRCQGRLIARGELVSVGGQLGMRVIEAREGAWSV